MANETTSLSNKQPHEPLLSPPIQNLRLPPGAELFVSIDKQSILYPGNFHNLLYSADGKVFRQVRTLSWFGGHDAHHCSFEDVSGNCQRHDVWRKNNVVLLGTTLARSFELDQTLGLNASDADKPLINFDNKDFALNVDAMTRHKLTAQDIANTKPSIIRCIYPHLVIVLAELSPAPCPSEVPCLRLPTVCKPEHLFRLDDGQLIYVSADKVEEDIRAYRSCQLYVGSGDSMEEILVRSVDRNLVGGTVVIRTDQHVLFAPSPSNLTRQPTWGERSLTRLDLTQFDITERDGRVTISPKL